MRCRLRAGLACQASRTAARKVTKTNAPTSTYETVLHEFGRYAPHAPMPMCEFCFDRPCACGLFIFSVSGQKTHWTIR